MNKKNIKALVLMSGGLDSMLAAKVLMEQGVEVVGLSFQSCFFGVERAKKSADILSIKLRVVDFKKDHLEMLKNPIFGYGKNFNPCIDCHLLMIQQAGRIMKKEGFDFVATGEVLGQRPFSQHKKAMDNIEELSDIKGYLLRPLSAQLLTETIPEKEGLIDRKKLLAISGRGRKIQMSLAYKFNLKEYSSPGGGCMLTNIEPSQRVKRMIEVWPKCQPDDLILAADFPRHFWGDDILIVLGKDQEENEKLNKIAEDRKDLIVEPKNHAGPTALIRFKGKLSSAQKNKAISKAEELIKKFSKRVGA